MSLESSAPQGLDPRFPALDTLRAVGALAVVTTHVGFESGAYTRFGVLGAALSRLDVGVAIFFVLSGFLLSRPYLAAAVGHGTRPRAGRYLWRRALRILPVYLVTAVAVLALTPANAGADARDWAVTLLLANIYLDPILPSGLAQMWSLAVEVAFYLVLPLLMLAAVGRPGRRLRTGRVVAVLAVLVMITVWWHVDGAAWAPDGDAVATQWLPGFLSWFAVGIGLALLHVLHVTGASGPVVTALVTAGRQPGSCWAVAAGLMLVAATPVGGPVLLVAPTASESLAKNLLYAGIAGLVVLPAVFAGPDGVFGRVAGAPWARHLGLVSYGVFCVHMSLLHLLREAMGWPLFAGNFVVMWVSTVAASLIVAELVYRLVELPAMRWRNLDPPWRRRGRGSSAADTTTATTENSTRY